MSKSLSRDMILNLLQVPTPPLMQRPSDNCLRTNKAQYHNHLFDRTSQTFPEAVRRDSLFPLASFDFSSSNNFQPPTCVFSWTYKPNGWSVSYLNFNASPRGVMETASQRSQSLVCRRCGAFWSMIGLSTNNPAVFASRFPLRTLSSALLL